MNKIILRIIAVLILLFLFSCDEDNFLFRYRDKRLNELYGRRIPKEEAARLQEEVKGHEQEILKLLHESEITSNLHRKIALYFAEMEAFQQCIFHLEQAARFGKIDARLKYYEGLCRGNLAQRNNWAYDQMVAAEQAYLAALSLDPSYANAKFELGLIYFYGFGRNNRYRVLNEEITISQQNFRQQGMRLVRDYNNKMPDDPRGYMALAGMYRLQGDSKTARDLINQALDAWRRVNPNGYTDLPEYREALQSLQLLGSP